MVNIIANTDVNKMLICKNMKSHYINLLNPESQSQFYANFFKVL